MNYSRVIKCYEYTDKLYTEELTLKANQNIQNLKIFNTNFSSCYWFDSYISLSSQCFDIDMIYKIYLASKFTVPK